MNPLDRWDDLPTEPPPSSICPQCGVPGAHAPFWGRDKTTVWRCLRCHAEVDVNLPFPPKQAPEGHRDGLLAIKTMGMFAPIIAKLDPEAVYLIVRPYFTRGWCARDVLHAMDYLPDGRTHSGAGVAWDRNEHPDKTLARLLFRLRTWRWGDAVNADTDDIMSGGYTAMAEAMRLRAEEQVRQQGIRSIEWHQQDEIARQSQDRDASAGARRVAAVAASLGRRARIAAQRREAEHMAAEFARGKAAAEAWRKLIDDEPPDETAS